MSNGDLRDRQPDRFQSQERTKAQETNTQALQDVSSALRELQRMMQRNGLGQPAEGGGTTGIRGQAAHDEIHGGGNRSDQAKAEGIQFVRQQRVLSMSGEAAGSLGDRYKSNAEKSMDLQTLLATEAAGEGARQLVGANPLAKDPSIEAAGEFAAQATRTGMQAAQQATRTRIDTMRQGMAPLEELAQSGVKFSDGMLDNIASTYNKRGGRLHDFRQQMSGAIDRNLSDSPNMLPNFNLGDAERALFGGGQDSYQHAANAAQQPSAEAVQASNELRDEIRRLRETVEAQGGIPRT